MMIDRTLRIAGLALALLWPGLALAADLTVSGSAEAEYDDNAFRSAKNEEDDVLFRFVPAVKIHEDRGQDLLYSLEYRVPLEFAVDNSSELDDVDQVAVGRMTYHLNDRTEFFARNRFGYLRGQQRDVTVTDISGTFVNAERDRVLRNNADVGVEYQVSPRLLATARAGHDLFDTDRDDRADNWLANVTGDLLYALTPRHQVGGGARYIRQEFDETDNIVGSQLNTVNVFAQWLWQIDETLDLSVSAGPSWIDNNQDDPDPTIGPQVQFSVIPAAIADATGSGFVDRDGVFATGPYAPGSVVAAQIGGCQLLADATTRVEPCLNLPSVDPAAAGVLLDPVTDAALISQVQTSATGPRPAPRVSAVP
jgi:hypothetical protein